MKIRELRMKAKISQQTMSKEFEIPKRTIENWETEKRKCPPYVEKLICEKLENIIREMESKKMFEMITRKWEEKKMDKGLMGSEDVSVTVKIEEGADIDELTDMLAEEEFWWEIEGDEITVSRSAEQETAK